MIRKVVLVSIGLSLLFLVSSYGMIPQQSNSTSSTDNLVAIPPRFESPGPFRNGLAAVRKDDRWGYINPKGDWEIQPRYSAARPFLEGRSAVRTNGQWGYIKPDGSWLVSPKYDGARSFHEGYAAVRKNKRWTFLDRNGSRLGSFRYDRVQSFQNGRAVVERNERKGYINRDGDVIIDPQYENARSFSDGKAPVKTRNGWGYINRKAQWVVQPQFEWADPFVSGRTRVRDDGEWYVLDADSYRGQKLDASFISRPDTRGFVRFKSRGNVGFRDPDGNELIEPKYSQALSFTDSDYTAAQQDGLWGYIDRSGEWVIKPQFQAAGPFQEGLAPVKVGNRWGYIRKPDHPRTPRNEEGLSVELDTGLRNVKEEILKTPLTERFPSWRDPGGERYVRVLSTGWDHWTREDLVPQSNHDMANAKYEVTRHPYEEPTYLQIEAAETLSRRTVKAARQNGWFSARVGLRDGYGLDEEGGVDHHFFKEEYFRDNQSLVPDRPETLMYYGSDAGDARLGGMMFYPAGSKDEGPQIGGPLTLWHYHVFDGAICHRGNLVQPFTENCSGGERRKRSPEMIHAWFIEHPSGTFGTETELKNLAEREFSLAYENQRK